MLKTLMFKFLLLISITSSIAQNPQDVLLSINGTVVTVEEFTYIYEKNNGDRADYSEGSVKEYLDLYKKFKLKVHEARNLQLDTIASVKEELDGYKRQLTNSFLMDREVLDKLLKELYERKQKDIRIAHIFIEESETATEEQKYENQNRLEMIQMRLKMGADFQELAMEQSDDKASAERGGDLGFFTAMLPAGFYNLENAIYSTPVGQVSAPVKTRIGWHIVKVLESRQARGEIEVAHILIKNDNSGAGELEINRLYDELRSGADFFELAKLHSQDRNSSSIGGLLPPFGINTYEPEFEEAAFSVEFDKNYSEPVKTRSGWHIILRNRKIPLDDFPSFKKKHDLKIKKDERYEAERKKLIEKIKENSGFIENTELFNTFIGRIDEEFLTYKWTPVQHSDNNKILFIFGDRFASTLTDFIAYCKRNTRSRLKYDRTRYTPGDVARILLNEFQEDRAIEFEQQNLGNRYSDFRSLLREYEEGILLFEVTKLSVWDKANNDSIGLENFYRNNKDRYKWDEKAVVSTYIINTDNKDEVNKIITFAAKKPSAKVLKKFNKKTQTLSVNEEKYEKNNPMVQGLEWKAGALSKPGYDHKNQKSTFKKIEEIIPASTKTLQESKGYVVADYQDKLEGQWVQELNKRYIVKVDDNVLKQLIKK
jgi:peptidyl-prolyl cis-trans isomerase SurA